MALLFVLMVLLVVLSPLSIPLYIVRGIASWWLPEDNWVETREMRRLDLTLTCTAWACFVAPFAVYLLQYANAWGLSLFLGDEGSRQFLRWFENLIWLNKWPWLLQIISTGGPYFLICLAFDWWKVRRAFPPANPAECIRLILWLWTANILSCAAIIGLLLAFLHVLEHTDFLFAK